MTGSFSDKLTPGQVRQVLSALDIQWQDKTSSSTGWVSLNLDGFNSTVGLNIEHGGFKDHHNGESGDIVKFISTVHHCSDKQSIDFIKDVTGITKGIIPPDIPAGFQFANTFLKKNSGNNFVRIPTAIMESKLSGNDKIVWGAIFSRCGKNEIYSYPGFTRICKDTGLSRPTVSKCIQNLVRYGLIIEKFRSQNLAPLRFPLVAEKDLINSKITGGSKDPLPGVVKNLSSAGKRSLPKLDTENYNQSIISIMHNVQKQFCTQSQFTFQDVDCSSFLSENLIVDKCKPCVQENINSFPGKKRKWRKARASRWLINLDYHQRN